MNGVLFLTESFHPVLGGGETHIRALASRLASTGMAATVITRRTSPELAVRERFDGIDVVRVPPVGAGPRKKFGMLAPSLAALVRERRRYDVVVVRGTRVLGLPGLGAARALGRGVVLQPELNGELSGEVYAWGKPWARGLAGRVVRAAVRGRNVWMRDADAFVAMSQQIAAEMSAAGVPDERIRLIPHGVDLERFRPASAEEKAQLRARLGLPPEAILIVFTGRLLRGKGLEHLVDAFDAVALKHAAAELVIVGSGAGQSLSIEQDLRARAGALPSASRIRFVGRVENVEDYLRAADVFAFPSEFEGLGLSLVEAAACGIPAVGSRTGGIVDVIEANNSGLLVEPGNASALAEALAMLLANAEMRRSFGCRAVEIARLRFDARESTERYRALFLEVASRGRGVGTRQAWRGVA